MIKDCTKCGNPTEFKDDHNKRQGYWCKVCRSKASVESAKIHRETKRKNNNAYSARNSANRSEATAKWRANHPEKRNAHQVVQTAIRNGTLKKQPCEICGSIKAIHAHHDDYEKPLKINWLCHSHHMQRHAMLKAREK
jgi:hypothetical protein